MFTVLSLRNLCSINFQNRFFKEIIDNKMTIPTDYRIENESKDLNLDITYKSIDFKPIQSTIDLKRTSSILESSSNFLNSESNNIAPALEMALLTSLQSLVDEANQIQQDTPLDGAHKGQDIRIAEYRKWKEYALAEDIFQEAYAHIVQNEPILFDTLLHLESAYGSAFKELKETLIFNELETENINTHLSELRATQKREFQQFTIQVYQELKDKERKSATLVKNQETMKKIDIDVIDGSAKLDAHDVSVEKLNSNSSATTTPPDNPLSKSHDKEFQKKIDELKDMGFEIEQALLALEATDGDMERAVMILLENPQSIKEHIRSKSTPTGSTNTMPKNFQATKSLLSVNTQNSMDLPRQPELIKNKTFSFSKINDIFKVKPLETSSDGQNSFQTSTQATNANLSDVFTIYSGSQVRSMTNIRLEVSTSASYFQPNPNHNQETALRMQTCMNLYSQLLTGIIVILKPSDFQNYCSKDCVNQGRSYI